MLIRRKKALKGEITVPGDKSISHRAVMFGSLARGRTEIDGFLMGEDCLSTIDCFRKMGINIELKDNGHVTVHGAGLHSLSQPCSMLYTGNSGTTTRLLLGILAGQRFETAVSGDASIQKRPMKRVTAPLREMGAKISSAARSFASEADDANFCPLIITPSKLHGITYKLPVASAQVKSALILAGLYSEGSTVIIEPVKSRNHTELMLAYFGAGIKVEGSNISVEGSNELFAQHIRVPGDISSAAFFITAGLLVPGSELIIRNVGINPTRTGILDVYKAMGGHIQILNERVQGGEPVADILVKYSELKAATIEGDIIPRLIDEIPVIAVTACMAQGITTIKDAGELKVKESNRIRTVVTEFTKLGANIIETEDGMIIEGSGGVHGKSETSLKGAVTESHDDHRIAMSLAVAGLVAEGETVINNSGIVDISFPGFFGLLEKM